MAAADKGDASLSQAAEAERAGREGLSGLSTEAGMGL